MSIRCDKCNTQVCCNEPTHCPVCGNDLAEQLKCEEQDNEHRDHETRN